MTQPPNFSRWCYAIAVCIGFLIISCSDKKPTDHGSASRAFYFWQTNTFRANNDSTFKSLAVKRIYCRVFDVGWNNETSAPIPVAPLQVDYNPWDSTEMVPVVFITNETFKKIDASQVSLLAKNVHARIMRHISMLLVRPYQRIGQDDDDWWWQQNPYQVKSRHFDEQKQYDSMVTHDFHTVREVQFDCDWTESTKEKYFLFLSESQKLFTYYMVSSTIRLYQYRYPEKAGVPPVKRSMLMCYNAGDVTDTETKNSIFDQKQIMDYLEDAPAYPISLDYALPIFGWSLLYHEDKLKSILPAHEMITDYQENLLEEKPGIFRAKQDFVFGYTDKSIFIREGDFIRVERPDLEAVRETAEWLGEHKNNKEAIISLYHLNDYDIQHHSKEIQAIYTSF